MDSSVFKVGVKVRVRLNRFYDFVTAPGRESLQNKIRDDANPQCKLCHKGTVWLLWKTLVTFQMAPISPYCLLLLLLTRGLWTKAIDKSITLLGNSLQFRIYSLLRLLLCGEMARCLSWLYRLPCLSGLDRLPCLNWVNRFPCLDRGNRGGLSRVVRLSRLSRFVRFLCLSGGDRPAPDPRDRPCGWHPALCQGVGTVT